MDGTAQLSAGMNGLPRVQLSASYNSLYQVNLNYSFKRTPTCL